MSTVIAVNVHIDGYWATERDLLGRDRTLKELAERNTGNLIQSGSNHRGMQFVYEVENEIVGKTKIELVLGKHLPGRTFTMETMKLDVSKETKVAQGIVRPKGQFQKQAASEVKNPTQLHLGLSR